VDDRDDRRKVSGERQRVYRRCLGSGETTHTKCEKKKAEIENTQHRCIATPSWQQRPVGKLGPCSLPRECPTLYCPPFNSHWAIAKGCRLVFFFCPSPAPIPPPKDFDKLPVTCTAALFAANRLASTRLALFPQPILQGREKRSCAHGRSQRRRATTGENNTA
jgi:hypothetical protein